MESMELLHEILAAEKKARTSCEQARRESGAVAENAEALRRRAEDEAMEKARHQLEAAEKEALSSVEDALREEDRRHRETMDKMAAQFAANRDACAERMFRMAVGLE